MARALDANVQVQPAPGGLKQRLLALPLFYKALIANCGIVVLGAVVGTWLTAQSVKAAPSASHLDLVVTFAVAGTAISLFVNFVVLRAAFAPLVGLTRTVEEVRRGNLGARSPRISPSDPEIDRLTETMNAMLDTLADYRRQLKALSSQVIQAQEAERKRIARELHDETAQVLTSLLVHFRLVDRSENLTEAKRHVAELRQLTSQALEDVRQLAHELRPTALDDLGLVAAAEWCARELAGQLGIQLEFEAIGFEHRLPHDVELVLYRIVQEAMTNVAKHANASFVRVRLEQMAARAVVTVEDNGRGFAVREMLSDRERGLGLFGMQERASLVGGNLTIESTPGIGTRIEVDVPLGGSIL